MDRSQPLTLVAIDDDLTTLELIAEVLTRDDLRVLIASDPQLGLDMIRRTHPSIVILDRVIPGVEGMNLLEEVVRLAPAADVLMLTGHYTTESAVEAIRHGACDYLTKPVAVELLRDRVSKLVELAQTRLQAIRLEKELAGISEFEGMVGRSPLMLEVFSRIRRVAPHWRGAMVRGATGTGKELVARALHRLSPVADGPFIVCNCSAIVETLFESELFGYVKGAFTGAAKDKAGMFEWANGGTLFLDELGDLPVGMQSKLLRVLQNQELQRVGSPAPKPINVRVVAATNRDLEAMMQEKTFREDLYYRLSMVEIKLPPLSERPDDLPLLIRHLIKRFAAEYGKPIKHISPRAQARLLRWPWPGNVRELENAIGSACMMANDGTLDLTDLPPYLLQPPKHTEPGDDLLPLSEIEQRHTLRVLQTLGGNKVKTAEVLGISRATLYRILGDAHFDSKDAPSADHAATA